MAFDLVQIRIQAQKKEDENLRFREFLKFERTFTCPIVYGVMEELKKDLRFSGR